MALQGIQRGSPLDFFAVSPSPAEQVLAQAQEGREVIQDFCPLSLSLEWQLGQEYLRQRGSGAFLSDASPVPFVINNDGVLSRNAAEIFFSSVQAAEEQGTLEEEIFVLELGVGLGLFARYFLDNFYDLCSANNKDYYDRLCYIAADRSEKMLLDVLRHGVLAAHPGRYRVRCVDAMRPEETLPGDVLFQGQDKKPFRAVFLNYLLDCLPAAVLEFEGDTVRQLCVRTCVARTVRLTDYTDLSAAQLRERAVSSDPQARQDLLEVYGLFASEYDYRPVDVGTLPHGEFARSFGQPQTRRLLHSHGAIQSLEKLLTLVADDGFILVNDYGPVRTGQNDAFEHQRFSLAAFVGVNFPLLKAFFSGRDHAQWIEPGEVDERGIHARMLSRKPASDTIACFYRAFGGGAYQRLQEPLEAARNFLQAGRIELAAGSYREALGLQPRNWVLLNEVSLFLTYQMGDPLAGADLAKLALALNPTCSSELWNTLGDALFNLGRISESRSAYLKALDVNDGDIRARLNLAWVYSRQKEFDAALGVLAEALALDRDGQYRERLLQKQQEVLVQSALRHQLEFLRMANLVSRHVLRKDGAKSEPSRAFDPFPRNRN